MLGFLKKLFQSRDEREKEILDRFQADIQKTVDDSMERMKSRQVDSILDLIDPETFEKYGLTQEDIDQLKSKER